MADKTQRKILLGFDGSDQSFEIINFIANRPFFKEKKIVLYSVHEGLPDHIHSLTKEPQFAKAGHAVMAWEVAQKKAIDEAMNKAREKLIYSGVSSKNIQVVVKNKKEGIARDILKESKKEYELLLIGRKGVGKLKEVFLGSVATKLVSSVNDLPLGIIGSNVPPFGRLLLPLDKSDSAMKVVDYVGATLGGIKEIAINLCHVIPDIEGVIPGDSKEFLLKEYPEAVEKEMRDVFQNAKRRLMAAGFADNQIAVGIATGKGSVAKNIILEADRLQCGAIVMGRRGLSRVKEFFMGRVSNEVIQLAANKAVWLVN